MVTFQIGNRKVTVSGDSTTARATYALPYMKLATLIFNSDRTFTCEFYLPQTWAAMAELKLQQVGNVLLTHAYRYAPDASAFVIMTDFFMLMARSQAIRRELRNIRK
jgi:hypothetical protein